jgi:hypothetical protein
MGSLINVIIAFIVVHQELRNNQKDYYQDG